MQVPIMSEELAALLAASSAGFDPRTIPLTHAASGHGDYAIFAACPPDATDTDRIATVAANVRGWLDTLT